MEDGSDARDDAPGSPKLALVPIESLVPRRDLNIAPPRWLLRPSTELAVDASGGDALDVPYPMIKEIKSDFISDNQLMRNLCAPQHQRQANAARKAELASV